ncbi:hypothetical protein M758_3G043200 [Ceratodon purpureus]|nr:hypothetical protein M758_3G043200 [Ceratodon purpureus]
MIVHVLWVGFEVCSGFIWTDDCYPCPCSGIPACPRLIAIILQRVSTVKPNQAHSVSGFRSCGALGCFRVLLPWKFMQDLLRACSEVVASEWGYLP